MKKIKGIALVILGSLSIFFSMYWAIFNTGFSFGEILEQYSYFTNQVSLLCGLYMILYGAFLLKFSSLGSFLHNPAVKTAVTVYAMIVLFGYYISVVPLAAFTSAELYITDIQSIYMHFIAPICTLILFTKTPFTQKLASASLLKISAYPILYCIFAQLNATVFNFFIYPILDPDVMGNMFNVVLASFGVISAGLLIELYFVKQYNSKAKRVNSAVQ